MLNIATWFSSTKRTVYAPDDDSQKRLVENVTKGVEDSFTVLLGKLTLVAELTVPPERLAAFKKFLQENVGEASQATSVKVFYEVDQFIKILPHEPHQSIRTEEESGHIEHAGDDAGDVGGFEHRKISEWGSEQ